MSPTGPLTHSQSTPRELFSTACVCVCVFVRYRWMATVVEARLRR